MSTVRASSGMARAALTVSGWNAVSRLTGFVRVLAVGAAFGTTFLGNTYQSSNLVSNLLFELVAAGILSAPLVAPFVGLLGRGRQEDAEGLAGTLLALSVAVLGTLALVLAVAGEQVMSALTAGVNDAAVRDQEIRLGSFFLWFFLPQVVFYAVGAVASALLNAKRRFAAAAFAPVANNLMVTATMVTFIVIRHGRPPTLDLSTAAKLVLALGTTAGVVAMSAVPLVALTRTGLRLRLRMDLRHPELPLVLRHGAWGAVFLACFQVLIGVTLVTANEVEGGVVAYQIAYTFFLLPVALVAHPIFTTLHPRMADHVHAGDWTAFGHDVSAGLRRMALLVLPAAAVLAALGGPVLRLLRLGALDVAGADLVAAVLAAYAVGLPGYGAFQLLARAAITADRARLPALVAAGSTAVGAVLMVVSAALLDGKALVVALGLSHSVAMTAGAAGLFVVLGRRLDGRAEVGSTLFRPALAAAAAGAVAVACTAVVGGSGRLAAAVELALGGTAAVAVGAGVLWLLHTPDVPGWRTLAPARLFSASASPGATGSHDEAGSRGRP